MYVVSFQGRVYWDHNIIFFHVYCSRNSALFVIRSTTNTSSNYGSRKPKEKDTTVLTLDLSSAMKNMSI